MDDLHLELKIANTRVMAKKLLRDHDLDHLDLEFGNSKTALGTCVFNRITGEPKRITISKRWIPYLTPDETKDTILHEIAHAIAGHKAGHGPKWRKVARNIGAKPERLADIPPEISTRLRRHTAKWKLTCCNLGCDNVFYRHRLKSNATYRCPDCKHVLLHELNPEKGTNK